jgi:hypothetical protein
LASQTFLYGAKHLKKLSVAAWEIDFDYTKFLAPGEVGFKDKVVGRAVSSVGSEEDKEIALIVNLTGLTEEEIDDLSLSDYGKLQDVLSGFMS